MSGCPQPNAVRLYVAEKNAVQPVLKVAEVVVNLQAREQHQEAHLARNPMGRVPVLEVEDGLFLGESLACPPKVPGVSLSKGLPVAPINVQVIF